MGRSRYEGCPTAVIGVPDDAGGTREVMYLLPSPPRSTAPTTPLAVHRVLADDRVDLLAARYLGDPDAWWRICDANAALDPDELVGPGNAGATIVVAVPGATIP
jgi:hypothetical protein